MPSTAVAENTTSSLRAEKVSTCPEADAAIAVITKAHTIFTKGLSSISDGPEGEGDGGHRVTHRLTDCIETSWHVGAWPFALPPV